MQFYISHGRRVRLEDMDVLIGADGYVRSECEVGKHLELILSFAQIVEAMAEEKSCDGYGL